MNLAWLTDIHLNFLQQKDIEFFCEELAAAPAEAFVITGDIGEAPNVTLLLNLLDSYLQKPVYFVLGNHDFYRGSIGGVRQQMRELRSACSRLHWLPAAGIMPLDANTCLVGHDGWGDGRCGDFFASDIILNDWFLIEELKELDPPAHLKKLHSLGDEAAGHFRTVLPEALARFPRVIVATHVPPFREASWFAGRISDANWLPHMACKAAGDVLAEMMKNHPQREMLVLCGHTHGGGEVQILPNLKVHTGEAEYGQPKLQRIITTTSGKL